MEGKRKREQLSEDASLDAALWELAEVLAEIAPKGKNPASSAAKHRPNDSKNKKRVAMEHREVVPDAHSRDLGS